jgi:hypothetical protein
MQVNNTNVINRHARPGVLTKVALDVYFINGGQYTDPYAISGVGVYSLSSNGSPSSILASSNLLDDSQTPLMFFANSSVVCSNVIFNASNYTPGNTASGIYKLSTGHYVVILDGTNQLSGVFNGTQIANTASAASDYIDAWQVQFTNGGGWNVLINNFTLYNDTFFTLTQPILLTTKAVLQPKVIKFGSTASLKIKTSVTIGNRDISQDIINIFKDAVILSPQLKIVKINENVTNLPAHVTVSSFSDTSALVDVTGDNSLIFTWNTNQLATHSELIAGNLGSITGTYAVQAKYTILNETILTPLMFFEVN